MDIKTYENALNSDAFTSIAMFKDMKSTSVYGFLGAMFSLIGSNGLSSQAQENLQKVIQSVAPTFPEDHLEKYYENGSSPDAFNVFEMFVDGGYHTSWQWGSHDLLVSCCLSGTSKYLPKFLARQTLTEKDAPLLVLASLNSNVEVFEMVLSHFDLQNAYNQLDQLYDLQRTVVFVEWNGFGQSVVGDHIKTIKEDLFNRVCAAQCEKITKEVSSVQPPASRKRM